MRASIFFLILSIFLKKFFSSFLLFLVEESQISEGQIVWMEGLRGSE